MYAIGMICRRNDMKLKVCKINFKPYEFFNIFIVLTLLKYLFFVFFYFHGHDFFGGGNDSVYYNAYALGKTDVVTSVWPVILRYLNGIGLYSREGVRTFLEILDIIVIPFLVAKLTLVRGSSIRNRVFWLAVVVISAYPTLTYFATDMYRDVFMVFLWLIGVVVLKALAEKPPALRAFSLFLVGLIIAGILFKFRDYLGFSYLVSLLFSRFYNFKKWPFFLSILILVVCLFGLFEFGFLDRILEYRSIFTTYQIGGSNLGIRFSSSVDFFPDLFKTTVYQLFGFYFVNLPSVIVFLLESVPFMWFIFYVVKNRFYSNKFVDHLMVFFVSYSIIWLLGNDNLGTAVRLRIFSYIAIFIAFCVIYQNKHICLKLRSNEKTK